MSVSTADGWISPPSPACRIGCTSPGHSTERAASAAGITGGHTDEQVGGDAEERVVADQVREHHDRQQHGDERADERVDQGGELAHARLAFGFGRKALISQAPRPYTPPAISSSSATRIPRLNGFQRATAGPARPLRSS